MSSAVLVGRERDLAGVADLLAPGGHRVRLVLVEGESGIGKTALADALASEAESRGVEVRWGAGSAAGDAPPYWLWRQVATEVAGEVPAGGDRFELFARLHEALDGRVGLVVVDDLQFVDESSLSALGHLARTRWRAAPAVLATLRTGEGGGAWRDRAAGFLDGVDVRVWALSGLHRDAVPELCTALGQGTPPGSADALYDESRGNPLLLRELLAATGAPRSGRYAELVLTRLHRLSAGAQELATAAAVVGDPFDLVVAARVAGRGVAASLSAVDELVSAGLCRALPERPGHLAFNHALTRDATFGALSLQKQVALHRKTAVVLERLNRQVGSRAAEIAGHWVAVAVTGERDPALHWSGVAADEAVAAGAWEEAVRLAARGLDCGAGALTAETEAPLRATRARALFLLGRQQEAAADARHAHQKALGAARADLAARAALALDPTGARHWDGPLAALLTAALDRLPAGDHALVARTHARLAATLVYLKEYARAAEHSAAALATAEHTEDPDVLVDVLHARQLTLTGPEHVNTRAALADQLIALGRGLDRPAVEIWGHLWAVDVAVQRGDLTAVEQHLAAVRRCADAIGTQWARWHLLLVAALLHHARGRFADAAATAEEAFAITVAQGRPVIGALASVVTMLWGHRGPDAEMLDRLTDIEGPAGEVNGEHFAFVGTALLLALAGRREDARRLYQRAGDPREWEIPPYFLLQLLAVGGTVARLLDERDDVAWFRGQLEPWRGQHVSASAGTASYGGPVALVLGQLAATQGDLEAAERDLTEAVAAVVANGSVPYEVEARVSLAEVVAALGRPAEARAALLAIRPEAERLGMAPWLSRIDELLGREPVLSRRETEVARLVARGYANADIARELVLSERTAQNHVQHILTKLGFRNRTQIAAWVSSGQLE